MSGVWQHNPAVGVAEDFGDEIVLMNPDTGAFYSLRGRAAGLWRACATGAGVADTTAAIGSLEAAESALLDGMLTDLRSAGILSVVDGTATAGESSPPPLGDSPATFTKNDDFNDLIRLDPIHDVDDAGWPFRK